MNRGIARRTIFEGREDAEEFFRLLAESVERGEIEVHAGVLMATHFHLLARSPKGLLSKAMRRIQLPYVRYFNRRRRRDGPLLRGRFRSKPVESLAYRRLLVAYIDHNPVKAGIVDRPEHYPYGSARAYLGTETPAWLERSWVESDVLDQLGNEEYRPSDYLACYGVMPPGEIWSWIERRIERPLEGDLDDLLGAAPEAVRDWAARKASLADGTQPGALLVPPEAVRQAIETRRQAEPGTCPRDPAARRRLEAGILRDAAGLTFEEIGDRLGIDASTAWRDVKRHHAAAAECSAYEALAAELTHLALESVARPAARLL